VCPRACLDAVAKKTYCYSLKGHVIIYFEAHLASFKMTRNTVSLIDSEEESVGDYLAE